MKQGSGKYFLTVAALAAIVAAGAFYADKVYSPPEPPPNIIYTIKGPVILHEQAQPGDLITAPNLGTIYYLNAQEKRVVFPDETTFLTWYESFDEVKTIPLDLLESFPLSGKNATIRPCTHLITIPSSHQVWLIGHPNDLHWLKGGEDQVIALFGPDWKNRLVDLPEYYFGDYNQGFDMGSDALYPAGLLTYASASGLYYLTVDHGQRLVTEKGFADNRFQDKFAIKLGSPLDLPLAGPPIDSYEPRWSSPDIGEQMADPGPQDMDIGGGEVEVG